MPASRVASSISNRFTTAQVQSGDKLRASGHVDIKSNSPHGQTGKENTVAMNRITPPHPGSANAPNYRQSESEEQDICRDSRNPTASSIASSQRTVMGNPKVRANPFTDIKTTYSPERSRPPTNIPGGTHSRNISAERDELIKTLIHSWSDEESKDVVENLRQTTRKRDDPMELFKFALFLVELSRNVRDRQNGTPRNRGMNGSGTEAIDAVTPPRSIDGEQPSELPWWLQLQQEGLKHIIKLAHSSISIGKPPLAEAQYLLAEFLSQGTLEMPIDHTRAFHLYIQASKQNHPGSMYRAAYGHEHGLGTKKNYGRALQFYRKAASLGEPHAMYRLAVILQKGEFGQQRNDRDAVMWLKRAVQVILLETNYGQHPAKDPDPEYLRPLHDLAACYEKTGGSLAVIPDERYSFELNWTAASLGYLPSQYRIGLCLEYGHHGMQKNIRDAICWYAKAADQGHPRAQLALSSWYLTGAPGVLAKDPHEAFLWSQKSALQDYPQALHALGYYHETGTGTPVSLASSLECYERASQLGNKRATKRYNELKKLLKQKKLPCPPGVKVDNSCCLIC